MCGTDGKIVLGYTILCKVKKVFKTFILKMVCLLGLDPDPETDLGTVPFMFRAFTRYRILAINITPSPLHGPSLFGQGEGDHYFNWVVIGEVR